MLTISKASAGAGKTHNLTGNYLRLLFDGLRKGDKSPYRHILAVTFTNKATAEMKGRIISELDTLARGGESKHLEKLVSGTGKGEKEVRSAAAELLNAILNDYTGFNVSTIDSFFQTILRAFAREMGQSSSYNVELDGDEILSQAVDSLMSSLDENEKDDLLKWLMDMAIEEIEQGNGWDVTKKLYGLGSFVFNERLRMKMQEGEVLDRDGMKRFRDDMKKLKKEYEDEVSSLALKGLELISAAGLNPEDFAGGSRSAMKKLETLSLGAMEVTDSFLKMASADSPENGWYSKTSPFKDVIKGLFDSPLRDCLRQIMELHTSQRHTDWVTAGLILKNFYLLGVVNDLRREIEKWCRENNSVILAQSNDFLRRIINRDETPFIYEKAATRIDSYMLDEFQDTSAMQWENFRPLVKESVDNGHGSLIVGDVKQSIYRWRNSDWELLASTAEKDFDSGQVEFAPLRENWRSDSEVVKFNNEFFTALRGYVGDVYNSRMGLESHRIMELYADVEQTVPEAHQGTSGHVKVDFIEGTDTADWKEVALEQIPERIETLKGQGFNPGDIGVLVRTNVEGAMVSDYLISQGYDIVTEDSLKVSASESVKKVISVLKYLLHPEDGMSKWLYERTDISVTETLDKPLYDLCEWTISRLGEEDRKQTSFLQAFLDCVKDYVTRNGSDLDGFIRWWDEHGSDTSISAPEGVSSIRVMTIHKSKGLEMKCALIPFLEADFTRSKGTVWCSSSRDPFRSGGLIPVNISKEMLDSEFRQDYLDEKMYQYIDNMNTVYVAFTRAVSELHVFARKPRKEGSCGSISDLLRKWLENRTLLDGDTYERGVPVTPVTSSGGSGVNGIFVASDTFVTNPVPDRIKASLRNAEKMTGSADERLHGIVMHDIFSRIETEGDAVPAVEEAVTKGEVRAEEKEVVLAAVRERLSQARKEGFDWFGGSYTLRCEVPVLSPGGGESRPDRVMLKGNKAVVVDYKFGALKNPAYVRQVSTYMKTLREMGFEKVEGFLWYNDGIEKVS